MGLLSTGGALKLARLAELNARLRAVPSRNKKLEAMAQVIADFSPDETEVGIAYLCGKIRQKKLNVGYATLQALDSAPALEPQLTLFDVDACFEQVASLSGRGSKAARQHALEALFAQATSAEQAFLRDLMVGELRQGALEALVVEAVARVCDLAPQRVRRAVMFSGNLRSVAVQVLRQGEAGIAEFGLTLFRPIQPMLAQPSEEGVAEGLRLQEPIWEYKIDGARVQIHRQGERVAIYTRKLNEVTDRAPELVELALGLPCHSVVLDGEAFALLPDGSPQPFQVTMSRFGRSVDVDEERRKLPLALVAFDCLHLDGRDLVDEPLSVRKQALRGLVPTTSLITESTVRSETEAHAFFEAALAAGHEGVMVKSGGSLYQAGKRGGDWLKIKPVHTLDLVVVGAEWGSGRRKGKLSNLHLAARGREPGQFVMLGKTFKGMTDAILEWQTQELLARALQREGALVTVRPELVVDVAFDGLLASQRYPGGVALRFARIRGYRHDKGPDDADTIDTVQALFQTERARGRIAADDPTPRKSATLQAYSARARSRPAR